jgi:hypothetical protein
VRGKFKSIILIGQTDKNYLEHFEKMRFDRNCNRGNNEQDYKRVITSWLEITITHHLSKSFEHDPRNILSWEELNSFNQYCRRYREIDGLFTLDEQKIYIEVKASLSKSNFNRGKTQINETLPLLASVTKNPTACLIMADCRCYDPTFGFAKEYIDAKIKESGSYKSISGLTVPTTFNKSQKWLWTLSQEDVEQLACLYGPPEEEDFEEYY